MMAGKSRNLILEATTVEDLKIVESMKLDEIKDNKKFYIRLNNENIVIGKMMVDEISIIDSCIRPLYKEVDKYTFDTNDVGKEYK